MIVSNHQQNILYFKEYPCYSMTTHLSQHREMEFAHVTLIKFSNQTFPKRDLPKFYIDKYQAPHQMYWLEWKMEDVSQAAIEEGRARINHINVNSQSSTTTNKSSTQSLRKKHCRCLYIAQLGKVAHIKLVFNSDPEIVAICQDFLYTIGGNQLIITELWPQNSQQIKTMDPTKQIPPKQSQIVHKLDLQSKVLSLDFVYDQKQRITCKVIYFNEKKGIYSQAYKKDQQSESSLLNKIIDFSLKFKKNEPQPLHYQTLIPNILGIVIYNEREFVLFNLTEMKPIAHTKSTLQGWELNHHQPIVIKTRQNTVHQNYNDCLSIGIGQGPNIEIFLFHIKYSSTATLVLPIENNNSKLASQLKKWPIHMFSSGEFIDFQQSLIKHWTVIHLQRVTQLQSFILSKQGLVYLGYEKGGNEKISSNQPSQQIPSAGFVDYETPYVTHDILMQENRVWREYKMDVLMGLGQQHRGDRAQEFLQRLLTPGRYELPFILSTFNLTKISDLPQLLHHSISLRQLNQKLFYTWRNDYKFIQFTIYHQQFLIIRKNSISTLIQITNEEYISSKDKSAQIEIGYDKLLRRDFNVHFDIEGDRLIEEENGVLQRGERSYEDKMRTISGRIKDVMSEQFYNNNNQIEEQLPIGGYYDQQQYKKCSQLYQQTLRTIIQLAKRPILTSLPQKSFTQSLQQQFGYQQSSNPPFITHNKHILLHASILSLRVKDQLGYYIDTLKTNYQYYFEELMRSRRQYIGKKDDINKVTSDMLQRVHLQHVYTVYILQWVNNIATKSHLQTQLALFTTDLISQFIHHYITSHCKGSYIQQNGTVLTTNNKLYKSDIDIHVNNVFSLLFRGLLKKIDFTMWDENIVQQAREVNEMIQSEIITDRVNKINSQANPLLMMLLKKHHEICYQSTFITDYIIATLFQALLLNPCNQTLSLLLPINKTFVYSILSLPIRRQQKLRILSSYMSKPQFLAILLLIQLENNCYLLMDEGMEVEIYGNNVALFVDNTVRLDREACCLLEELILTNYKLFLFPVQHTTKQQHQKKQSSQITISADISDPQLQKHQQKLSKSISIQFIKLLFSNIDFMQLTFMITRPFKSINQQQFYYQYQNMNYHSQNQQQDGLQMMIESDKGLAYVYRQLMLQVEKINQNYGPTKGTPIERTFKKFFNKIYHPKPKHQSPFYPTQKSQQQQTYPQLTGLDYHLSLQELNLIDRLYAKQLKLLKMDKKQSFQSTSIIQQRLNLQYSILKILMFRLNLALKEIALLTEADKLVYVEIMKRCVEGLRGAVKSFKHWRKKLTGEISQEKREIGDEKLLEILVQIDSMENSNVQSSTLNDTYETIQPIDEKNKNWLIMGKSIYHMYVDIPLSQQWLQLLLLTFTNESLLHHRPTTIKSTDITFTNYQSLESILMKMLIVIKKEHLVKEYESLNKIFGQQKVDDVILKNQLLRSLYANGLEGSISRRDNNLISGQYDYTGNEGLLTYGNGNNSLNC